MNEFEKRMNALRLQFKAERELIQKDANRTIGRLNTAIGQVNTPEAREALRSEKARVYEATHQSMRYNRLCYRQQLELLEDEYNIHLGTNPSKRELRRLMAQLYKAAKANGESSFSVTFDGGRRADVYFT